MNEPEQSPKGISFDWRITGTVVAFSAALLLTAALRYLNLHAEDPSQLSANATPIYIGFTVLAAVLLRRSGVPMKRFGFGLVFGSLTLAVRGSIWPAALAHVSNNSIGIVSLYVSA